MTISPRISSVLRCFLVLTCAFLSFIALNKQSHWLLIMTLSFLATLAVLKTPNVLLHWPIGLLALIGGMYGNYVWQWIRSSEGVTKVSSSASFLVLIVLSTFVAMLRAITNREQIQIPRLSRLAAVITMASLPLVLMILVTTRWFEDPVRIISGHLGGGDHGPHNKIVHHLLNESGKVSFTSPFQMYSYPQSLHFVIANLVALTRSTTELPLLAQEYAMGAWFEWLQFAAFCQLSITIFMHRARSGYRFLFIPILAFVFAAMDKFVVQMLWSGFTTSIGITWILLAFVLVSERLLLVETTKQFARSVAILVAFAAISWTVYQPYSVIFVFLLVLVLCRKLALQTIRYRVLQLANETISRPLVLLSGVTMSVIVFMLFVLGRDSPAVTSLSLEGSTFKPFLYTVLLWAFLAIALTRYRSSIDLSTTSGLEPFTIIHFGFVTGFAGTVVLTSEYGFLNLPYYPQKMLWTLLFVSLPIVLMHSFNQLEDFFKTKNRVFQVRVVTTLLLATVMTPLIQGRAPANATSHVTVGWFAKGMVIPLNNSEASAFSMRDKLGSHMANLALQSVSTRYLSPDVAISGNPYLACQRIDKEQANAVYTTSNGRNELVESGCDPNITYVEDGIQQPIPQIKYFDIATDVEERPAIDQLGFRLLLRGFLPPEKWGTWAGGYRSALGFNIPKNLKDPALVLRLRPHPKDEEAREVVLKANDVEIGRTTVGFETSQQVEVSLPKSTIGNAVEFTITCVRSDDEILKDDPVDGPNPCVGLRSLTLIDKR